MGDGDAVHHDAVEGREVAVGVDRLLEDSAVGGAEWECFSVGLIEVCSDDFGCIINGD